MTTEATPSPLRVHGPTGLTFDLNVPQLLSLILAVVTCLVWVDARIDKARISATAAAGSVGEAAAEALKVHAEGTHPEGMSRNEIEAKLQTVEAKLETVGAKVDGADRKLDLLLANAVSASAQPPR